MTIKKRFRNKYRLEVRERDHNPAHVHLVGGNVDMIIDRITFETSGDCPRDIREEVVDYVKAYRKELLKEWDKWH